MEAVLLIGIPGSGKSSFYKERFFATHVRLGLDLLRTQRRQQRLLETCLAIGQRLVLDNTHPTIEARRPAISAAKAARFSVIGYYFQSLVEPCLRRNQTRAGRERVPDVAVLSIAKQLERPSPDEGFDRLFYVRLEQTGFSVEPWCDEL